MTGPRHGLPLLSSFVAARAPDLPSGCQGAEPTGASSKHFTAPAVISSSTAND